MSSLTVPVPPDLSATCRAENTVPLHSPLSGNYSVLGVAVGLPVVDGVVTVGADHEGLSSLSCHEC
jgi:hypothetical protein